MNKSIKGIFLGSLTILVLQALVAFAIRPRQINLFLIGDSTMAIKSKSAYPETGWGMPFCKFFDSTVTVSNFARNGSSTRTFIKDGLWSSVMDKLGEGDYVFIEFGHNDEVQTKAAATTETEFADNLRRFIDETRSKGGVPLLLTSVARRKFDAEGNLQQTHEKYAAIVRELADEMKVNLIDIDRQSQQLIRKFGPIGSQNLFNYLEPSQNPNYPNGSSDDTHLNELGARKVACIVLSAIKQMNHDLAQRIVKPSGIKK
ncbi:rhamnogalacturonan acetylesterase [Pedobacter jeongneungensis]|uniref:rhamnogalacturonan acetylesterase n=1 Tax=Pedobacter jeongneungensis TaxID=947309 RepID=UPI0004688FB6|nr:rhamnogalacturonan acetylesterase [Pedobacter jeongneungensis]